MHAESGDWLVIERAGVGQEARRGLILAVPSGTGTPPYRVRWLDNEHEALVFPGPDAYVLARDELAEAGARVEGRAVRVQREILRGRERR
jgi:hypothetical protein